MRKLGTFIDDKIAYKFWVASPSEYDDRFVLMISNNILHCVERIFNHDL